MTNELSYPSFREESDDPSTRPPSVERFYDPVVQNGYERMVTSMADADPQMAVAVESIARDYPTISADLLAGLALSGQAHDIPTALLDEMVQRDTMAQEAAADNTWYGSFKGLIRHSFLGMEDLYNVSPLMAGPRIAINMYQGQSLDVATNRAFASSLRNELRADRFGLETDYGTGFLPSQELVPQGQDFWLQVKESILAGEFEGSPEEELVAAQQKALTSQMLDTGFNPYALARAEWLSTRFSRTVNGESMSVPFSPGAAVAIRLTTPGTRAYETFSGFVDASFRITAEPIDVALDNLGDVFRLVNPIVTGDVVIGTGRGSKLLEEVLADFDISIVRRPHMLKTGYVDNAGRDLEVPAWGTTSTREISAEGVAPITVDPHVMSNNWGSFLDDVASKSGDEWVDPTDRYVRSFVERGMTPNDVRRALSERGGEQAQLFLTLEHELVHAEKHQDWYHLIANDDGSGTFYVDHALAADDAPEELRRVSQALKEDELTLADFAERRREIRVLREQAEALDEEVQAVGDMLYEGVGDAAARKQLTDDFSRLTNEITDLQRHADAMQKVDDDLTTVRDQWDEIANDFIENDATATAWDRMIEGEWAMPEIYKAYKRKHGLTNILRPYVNPKHATEWLNSRAGQRTIQRFVKNTDFEYVRKHAKYVNHADQVRLMRSADTGEVAEILHRALNGAPSGQRPTIGVVSDQLSHGLDGWQLKSMFLGGRVSNAYKQAGRTLRRSKAGVGSNTMSVTDLDETLDTINSVLSSVGASSDEISALQVRAVDVGHTKTGLDEIYDSLRETSIRRLKESSDDLYEADEIELMWREWESYEIQNRHYWMSNAGNDRKALWIHGKFKLLNDLDANDIKGEAFMEAQFASAHRIVPDIRRLRRLHSRQRNAWERAKQIMDNKPPGDPEGWKPLGFNTSTMMGVGDWSFGIWRDLQLMRGGWALRILPEEQLRFGGSGYSGLFKHPVDYFVSMMNRLDVVIPGDEMTLGDLFRLQEGLGTAGLRDLRLPPHKAVSADWKVASLADNPEMLWAGLSREYLLNSHDRIVSLVASEGRDSAARFLATPDGQVVVREIAAKASKNDALSLIANQPHLESMLDVVELRLAQVAGGDGIWFDPMAKQWVDLNDAPIFSPTDRAVYPNKDTIRAEIVQRTGNPDALKGMSRAKRPDLEAMLDQIRGYSIDDLDATGRAAFVTSEGNADLRNLVANRQLDDIVISEDMSFAQVRALDKKLEAAYQGRDVTPPRHWPVPADEMTPDKRNLYNDTVDSFFHWFNAVPSKVLNRQPFFAQAFGSKMAEVYWYGDTPMRQAITKLAAANDDFGSMFEVGSRKLFRDRGVGKFPKPFEAIDGYVPYQMPEPPSAQRYMDHVDDGLYDQIPLAGGDDMFMSHAFFETLEQIDVGDEVSRVRGTYRLRPDADPSQPGLAFRHDGDFTDVYRYDDLPDEWIPEEGRVIANDPDIDPVARIKRTTVDRLNEGMGVSAERQVGDSALVGDPEDAVTRSNLTSTDVRSGDVRLDTSRLPGDERNETVERVFGQHRYVESETAALAGDPTVMQSTIDELEELMKAAKRDSIAETKDVFYDLTNKANIADAYKFVFPFGDAWYEVLSRWAHIMNPVRSGGQSFRNVRRVQQTLNASRQSGFLSTNEYGEEVFNWPLAPGMLSNAFIPNDANVQLQGSMAVSSLMFIDPSARGVLAPGTTPLWQLGIQFTAPHTDGIPILHDTLQWMTYGDKTEYRPGEIEELSDVVQGFVPTVFNRMVSWVFDEEQRESLGTTKLRLFQSLGMSGDKTYDLTTPWGTRRAWDTADLAGTWLAWLRIMDSWLLPGQPQYMARFTEPSNELAPQAKMTLEEVLAEASKLTPEQQAPILSALRYTVEYRNAREVWGDAEADIYMLERHGVLPAFLQSASSGLVDRPVTWGGVEWVNSNEWLRDVAPYTLAATVPADADDTFSSAAWNNLYGEFLLVDGAESKPVRTKRSPAEFAQAVTRSVGYDQIRHQNAMYDQAVEALRETYGDRYASNLDYRSKKKELDRILRSNIERIYTEFPIVRGSNQGAIVGSVESVTLRSMVDEIIDIGRPGTTANRAFRTNVPHLADVAEQYSLWFQELEFLSRMVDEGTASSEWWISGESDKAVVLRQLVADAAERYYGSLENDDARSYAKWLNEQLLDDLLKDWEWIDRQFAPELDSFPSVWQASTIPVETRTVTP